MGEFRMIIDWESFTPWASLGGGVLIGLSVSFLVLLNGRVAGISGILAGIFRFSGKELSWQILFILGLILSPLVYSLFAPLPHIEISAGWPLLLLAGLLVGFGTQLGSGCTSGHGVCGLSRVSPRSLAATLLFMFSGFATVYVIRHVIS